MNLSSPAGDGRRAPRTGYRFTCWEVDGVIRTDTTPEHRITMNANHTIVAHFSQTS
ncbi:hypothetical protein HEP87_45455 [Streptomyces sp. S1D4-11]|nr:hypothetical protein [Streptomyces sp. S1D4-11]QIY99802.1 hypothetical protein HEP87_45455 [Streptomyces sp. S1D4-11]